jgi:phytoene dehydrogenase-like protein
MAARYDVIIIGAGHNGLVAAAYLARAGKKVLILEAESETGGATASVRAFPEYEARLSRYSYLISLFPDKIISDLQLDFRSIPRKVASYTPYMRNGKHSGLLVAREWDNATEDSFRELTGNSDEGRAWRLFYSRIADFAAKIAPTLLEPMPSRSELRKRAGMEDMWRMIIDRPIGESILGNFESDIIRGIVLTDALIGTHVSAFDIQANRCFLYHLMGNGNGEWKVPQGGMGALVSELQRVAVSAGAKIRTGAKVTKVNATARRVEVVLEDGKAFSAGHLLCNAAPQVLAKLRGMTPPEALEGSQLKMNMLLKKLPSLRSGADPKKAFAGTLHIGESFSELEKAYAESKAGRMPGDIPLEIYCHSLTDPSILSEDLQSRGFHTLTLFGLHTPASLFDADNSAAAKLASEKALAALNRYLAEPIEDCLARSADGEPFLEVKTPLDLEASISLPRGNIFHKDLCFPFREEYEKHCWGVETDDPRIMICGSGAIRGGGVSGIPGHNAAMAVIEATRK